MSADFDFRRYANRDRLGRVRQGYRCPACLQNWYAWQGLVRHMRVLHHKCRFCPKAYIRVERHEKLTHTNEYAIAAGACARGEQPCGRQAPRPSPPSTPVSGENSEGRTDDD